MSKASEVLSLLEVMGAKEFYRIVKLMVALMVGGTEKDAETISDDIAGKMSKDLTPHVKKIAAKYGIK